MPQITLQRWGIKISWTRHNVVTITTLEGHGLPVSDSKSKKTTRIPLIIRIGREDLLRYSQWPRTPDDLALRCLRAIPRLWHPRQRKEWFSSRNGKVRLKVTLPEHDIEVPVEQRKVKSQRTVVMQVPANPVTIELSQEHIEPLREALRRQDLVYTYLHLNIFFPATIRTAPKSGSRLGGRLKPQARLLITFLPEAFFFAHRLLTTLGMDGKKGRAATRDKQLNMDQGNVTALRKRVMAIILEDNAEARPGRFTLEDVVYLVERAFRGAWQYCGLTPPSESDSMPLDYLRRYIYGTKSQQLLAQFGFSALFDDQLVATAAYIAWWKSLLLGPPGAAAHAFWLLPADKK